MEFYKLGKHGLINALEALMKTDEFVPTARETRVLRMLRALANPARFRIVALLAERKDCTSVQLTEALPLAQSSLFDHLTNLREAGIVQVSSDRPDRYYCLDPSALRSEERRVGKECR